MSCYYAEQDKKIIDKGLQVIIIKKINNKKNEECLKMEKEHQNKNKKIINMEFGDNNLAKIKHSISERISERNNKILIKSEKKIENSDEDKIEKNNSNISNEKKLEIKFNTKPYEKNKIFNGENNAQDIQIIKELTKDSYTDYTLDNTFLVFSSIDDIFFLIYATYKRTIVFYNILDNVKFNEIKNAHNRDITNFRHFSDDINKRDLIISISLSDNNLKLWDISNFVCLLNIENVNKTGRLFSACLLNFQNSNYLITSNAYGNNLESIKVFDFNGIKIKEINDSNESTYFIDIYKDKNNSKIYILTGNNGYVKSYDFVENKIYHKYADDDQRHCSIIIDNHSNNNEIKMFESSFDGHLRIWDFHLGILLNKIKVCDTSWLFGICLWNEEFLFVGCGDKSIKLIELKNGLIVNTLFGNKNKVLSVKKITLPKYGGCLVYQGYEKEQIKILLNKNLYLN